VKIVVQVLLVPDAGQAPALESTLPTVNEAANRASATAF
jgi:putative transposase